MKLVLMSDSHGAHNAIPVPNGDIFVHAGDFSGMGREEEVKSFAEFLRKLPHKHKIVIAGNHEVSFERNREEAEKWLGDSCTYLNNSGVTVEGLKFWGSPVQPFFDNTNTWVFGVHRPEIKDVWDKIPENTDVLITHGGPYGILDKLVNGENVGCPYLLTAVKKIKPKLHVFGHIHEAMGIKMLDGTLFVNAAILDEQYRLIQGCTVIEL